MIIHKSSQTVNWKISITLSTSNQKVFASVLEHLLDIDTEFKHYFWCIGQDYYGTSNCIWNMEVLPSQVFGSQRNLHRLLDKLLQVHNAFGAPAATLAPSTFRLPAKTMYHFRFYLWSSNCRTSFYYGFFNFLRIWRCR